MAYDPNRLLDDIGSFADLGTEAPVLVESGDSIVLRLIRGGEQIELICRSDNSIRERTKAGETRHAHLRALLASPTFADLSRWAESQRLLLKDAVRPDAIPVKGRLNLLSDATLKILDDFLVAPNGDKTFPRTLITLIDGPAGIGKTSILRALAYRRASTYRSKQRPLILHVESRGRVLQNLTDLVAFSLQTLRLPVMYDQVPALVRHGLITLAIDGFDELGDPNGYELAWTQVNDVIEASRGSGCIVLSGRETFISEERMAIALTSYDAAHDVLASYSVLPIEPNVAEEWLQGRGWSEALLNSPAVSPLFEEGSYALRPFFLVELAREGVPEQIESGDVDDLLAFLIRAMLLREADKFGKEVSLVTSAEQRVAFLARLMEEVSRDLADNQTDTLSSDTLVWIAEVVAADLMPSAVVGILKNRAGVVAFLTEDDRRGYRRFIHEQVFHYFLSHVAIDSIVAGETPKFIRRNIFGLEALERFSDVSRRMDQSTVDNFIEGACAQLSVLGDNDRSRQNIAALVIAMCSVAVPKVTPEISEISFDELYFTESVAPIILKSISVRQLYCRSADLRNVTFEGPCYILSMLADEGTIPSDSLPATSILSLPQRTITEHAAISEWALEQQWAAAPPKFPDIDALLQRFPLFDLLARVARYKPFWLKTGDDKAAKRILEDSNWDTLRDMMIRHDLLAIRHDVPASGRPGEFYHVRNRQQFLDLRSPPEGVVPFLQELLRKSLADNR